MSQTPYGRKDRLIREKHHDSYYEREKLPEPTRCPGCGAFHTGGRWTWTPPAEKTPPHRALCPACRRINDNYPAGRVEIEGDFFPRHREEIENLIRHVEEQEKANHPLQRLIKLTLREEGLLATTTGIHLARRIGESLWRAYKGDLTVQYADEEQSVRVYWRR
jgi:NMD protein affecting ribosome stability and mRNA decay